MKMLRVVLAVIVLCLAFGAVAQDAAEAELKTWRDAYAQVRAALDKDPDSPLTQRTYLAVATRLGTITMNSPALTPREKYPEALRIYRAVLAVAPNQPEAKQNKEMIEEIYRSMGRPIPET